MTPAADRRIDRPIGDDTPRSPTWSEPSDSSISAGTTWSTSGHFSSSGRLGRRGLSELRNQLSERDWSIIRSVGDFRFLTSRHIQVMHFDGAHPTASASARSCGRVLARLTRLRLLSRLEQRHIGGLRGGSGSHTYGLGIVGHRLLERKLRQGQWEPSTTFLNHSLAVADVFVALVIASKRAELQLIAFEPEPTCWRTIRGYGATESLRPDFLVVIAREDLEYHYWIEVDLGSEHRSTIAKRCEQYLRHLQTGEEQALRGVYPRVIWLTTSEARASRIRQVAEHVQGAIPIFEVGLLNEPLSTLLPAEGSR